MQRFSRQESLAYHTQRHPMEIEFTTGCDENGILTGMKATIIADTGAYASLGGPVLHRACTHAAGPYNYQNVDILGMSVYTNNMVSGAFRGFGAAQSCFAMENNLNILAEKVGISPWEIRYRNAIRPGQILPNGQIADESVGLVECLEAVKEARAHGDLSENFEYHAAKKEKNRNESRIRYLEKMIKTAIVVKDESKDDEVGINKTVELYFEDDDEVEEFKIVTTVRGNSLKNLVSTESPIGKALLGHKVGDRVWIEINANAGYFVEIKSIRAAAPDEEEQLRKF